MKGRLWRWWLSPGGRLKWAAPLCFGLLFGLQNALALALFYKDQWNFLVQSPGDLLQALLLALGMGLAMALALAWVATALEKGLLTGTERRGMRKQAPPGVTKTSGRVEAEGWQGWTAQAQGSYGIDIAGWLARAGKALDGFGTVKLAGLLALCWLPYLIVFFPGTLSWDVGEMLRQFFGLREMDTWHGVFLTWVAGGCFALGRLLGSDTLGSLLLMALQTAALAMALGYALACVKGLRAKRWVRMAALVFFALCPIWASYAQFLCKDTLYTACVLVMTLQVMRVAGGEPLRWKGWTLLAAAALLCCLLRNNGLYVALPTAALLAAFGATGRERLRAGVALGVAVALALGFSTLLVPALGIRDETASGLYAVAFQQSARVLRDHSGDGQERPRVTQEEYDAMDAVLDADNLPELYEPWIADPVKYTFRAYGQGAPAEKAALAEYRKAWLAMAARYPWTYAEAFIAGNSGYYAFLPKLGASYNNQAGNRFVFEMHPQIATHLDVHSAYVTTQGLRDALAMAARGWRRLPILGLLYSCPLYTWLLVAAGISLARQRRWRQLIAFVPALLSFGTCLLSPVNDYFRYFLPVVACALPLIVLADAGSTGKKAVARAHEASVNAQEPQEQCA